jgi:hypothetical protein
MASYIDSCAPEVSNTCRSGSVDVPKESVSLHVKRASPSASTVGEMTWGNSS